MLAVLVAAALAAWQQGSDPFAGEYRNAEVQVHLEGDSTKGVYKGTILFQGASMPLTARMTGVGLQGSFQSQGESFPFELRKERATLLLVTGGETYRLEAASKVEAASKESGNPLTGSWRSDKGIMRFNEDGTGAGAGEAFRYRVEGTTLTFITAQTSLPLQFSVRGNVLTLRGSGGETTLSRVIESAGGLGSVQQELAGKYCCMANVNAVNGGARSSSQCITLHADGRYEYYGETDSYNPYGGATSQSGDRGTWTATESTITSRSATGKVTTFQLEKRNHPKNNDPMIVLDGRAFVTFFQKPPWR